MLPVLGEGFSDRSAKRIPRPGKPYTINKLIFEIVFEDEL
jgi:hypothetical protein